MARMKHRRQVITNRQRRMVVVLNVAGLAYAIIGIIQLAFGNWTGLVGLACSAGLLTVSWLAQQRAFRHNRETLLTVVHVDDPDCPCRPCEEAREEGYGVDVD